MSITGGGKRPLRLEKPGVKMSAIRRVRRDYIIHTDEIEILNCDGGDGVAASMRELVAPYLERMIATS